MHINSIGYNNSFLKNPYIFDLKGSMPHKKMDNNNSDKKPATEQKRILSLHPHYINRNAVIAKRLSLLKDIRSRAEYIKILDEILNYQYIPYSGCNSMQYVNLIGYNYISNDFKPIVAYCGCFDISRQINMWLTGRFSPKLDILENKKMANIVNALDYSLSKLDDKFGKYEGTVYRKGYFNPITDKQYYSSSINPNCIINMGDCKFPNKNNRYSIIRVKNAHNIYEFQKYVNSGASNRFAKHEEEILIDRKSNFRKINESEYTKEDIKLKEDLLVKICSEALNNDDREFILKNFANCLEYISIWEEI